MVTLPQPTLGSKQGHASVVSAANATEREKNLQDQIRQLKKHMHYKENEFNKDKAVWIQKYELCGRGLSETREQLESQ